MTMRGLIVIGCTLQLAAFACGPKRIPPGTPPPEYEQPVVTPWPSPGASAEPARTEPEPPAEPDAGGVDAGGPPPSDASATEQQL